MEREIAIRARLPEIENDLKASHKNLTTAISKKLSASRGLAQPNANLDNLAPKLRIKGTKQVAVKVEQLSHRVVAERRRSASDQTAAELRGITDDLHEVLQSIKHLIEDRKWQL